LHARVSQTSLSIISGPGRFCAVGARALRRTNPSRGRSCSAPCSTSGLVTNLDSLLLGIVRHSREAHHPLHGGRTRTQEMQRKITPPVTAVGELARRGDVDPVITDKFLSILATKILPTKILPPRRVPGMIRWERLLDLIDQVQAKALTVIRAAQYTARPSVSDEAAAAACGRASPGRGVCCFSASRSTRRQRRDGAWSIAPLTTMSSWQLSRK
jgi:hypothetical protein